MAKKATSTDRRRKVEELKRQQRRAERRRTLLIVGTSAVIGLGLVGAVVVPAVIDEIQNPGRDELTAIGTPLAAAGCTPVKDHPKPKSTRHVEDGTKVRYDTTPPNSGDHWAQPAPSRPKFVGHGSALDVERYVHSLEHGYVIAWYGGGVDEEGREQLEAIADKIGPKFIAVPWTGAPFADNKAIGLSAWQHTQLCSEVSGEAIKAFYDAYHPPKGDAPEKAAL